MKQFTTTDGKHTLTRLSRWITVNTNYNPSERNSLYDYSTDGSGYRPYQDGYDPTGGTYLDYFRFGGWQIVLKYWPSREHGGGCSAKESYDYLSVKSLKEAEENNLQYAKRLGARLYSGSDQFLNKHWQKLTKA